MEEAKYLYVNIEICPLSKDHLDTRAHKKDCDMNKDLIMASLGFTSSSHNCPFQESRLIGKN